jgi:glycosyltransferase involved in cell wall biosynthesis
MSRKRCIIIPAFNEGGHIVPVIEGIKKYSNADIVVIDDGSRDGTGEKAKKTGVLVIRHPFNMGYGVALQTGYKYALKNKYDFLLQMDGDEQHDPKYIPLLFQQVESSAWDVVIGSRFLQEGDYPVGTWKGAGIKIFRVLIRLVTRKKITDPTSGYQCFNKQVYEVFCKDIFPSDYPDANVIIMLHRMGFKIKEIPVTMTPNPDGKSMHQGFFTVLYYLFKVFLSLLVTLIREKSP